MFSTDLHIAFNWAALACTTIALVARVPAIQRRFPLPLSVAHYDRGQNDEIMWGRRSRRASLLPPVNSTQPANPTPNPTTTFSATDTITATSRRRRASSVVASAVSGALASLFDRNHGPTVPSRVPENAIFETTRPAPPLSITTCVDGEHDAPPTVPGTFPGTPFARSRSPSIAPRTISAATAPSTEPPPWSGAWCVHVVPRRLFMAYLVAHTILYAAELTLTTIIHTFPTMALHHAVALLLFTHFGRHLPHTWPFLHPLHLLPFVIHALYWATLPDMEPDTSAFLLAAYNLALVAAAIHARRSLHRALDAVAAVAVAVAAVNYWTYCWEFDGGWCVASAGGTDGSAVAVRVRDMVVRGWTDSNSAEDEGRWGAAMVGRETARDLHAQWMAGVVNAWFASAAGWVLLGVVDLARL
ncbi:hypothetical protein AMAG_17090 [Allomyces macrogynus ATCC 38327]|uniref:Uncharacterized protein n=1 Tax=Allomyces macrogynus (strain ATCC 38327) TaxID=578462 RepID=A0A0L0TDG0_ALLM3|nr:hypothetical protein AMAG_17090 [Allomyces macrogynus ATCC 38327]|eukprot:KNE72762.1 hypothetical protein AMAG_17090 [Allomyces macrogynus ATCC 38327]